MARRGPESTLRYLSSPATGAASQTDDYWELVKEGPIGLPENGVAGKSQGAKGVRLRQRWMMLAKLRCNCGCLTGDSKPDRNQTILLRTSKLAGGGRRKVQEYDLACYRMITSAFSSSVGTLGPKAGGGNYHFTIHAAADYTFAAMDETCMLSWVAALKEVLSQPSVHNGKLFAVEYSRASMLPGGSSTPHVSTQTTSLMELSSDAMCMKHPLTEEVNDECPIKAITDMSVHTQRQCLDIRVCPSCCPAANLATYRINTQCSVRRLAEAILYTQNLQVPGPPGQREWSCALPHSCDNPATVQSIGYNKLHPVDSPLSAASALPHSSSCSSGSSISNGTAAPSPVVIPRKVTLRRRSLGVASHDKPMTVLREGEVVNMRRSLPPESLTTPRSPVAPQRRSLTEDCRSTKDGYLEMKSCNSSAGSPNERVERTRSESSMPPQTGPHPVPRKHARLSRARDSTLVQLNYRQHSRHSDAHRTESVQSNCSCGPASESQGFGCRLHVSTSLSGTGSHDVDVSDDEGYISMAQQSKQRYLQQCARESSSGASATPPSASRRSSFLGDERPAPPPKPAFLRMLSGASSVGLELDHSPGYATGQHEQLTLDYEDVETEDDSEDEEDAVEGSDTAPPMYAPCHFASARAAFPTECVYESWEDNREEVCQYVVPDAVTPTVRRSRTEPMLTTLSAAQNSCHDQRLQEDGAAHGAYITFLSEGNGGQLLEQSDAGPPTATSPAKEDSQAWVLHQLELQRSMKLRLARRNCLQRYQAPPSEDYSVGGSVRREQGLAPRPKPRGIVRNSARTSTF